MFEVVVVGLTKALTVPERLGVSTLAFKRDAGKMLVEAIRENIHSQTGRLSASWTSRVRHDGQVVVSSNHPGAKASVRGAYIVPKRAHVLRFRSGAYSMRARYASGSYVGEPGNRQASYLGNAFAKWGWICTAAYQRHFSKLGV